MSHHVPVGVIAEDEVVLLRLDRLAEHVGDAGSTHLRHQVVGRDLLGGDEDALLAGVRGLDAAIEEVRDVGVLLRLGGAEHRLATLRKHLSHDTRQHRGPERDREREGLVVLSHGHEPDPRPSARVEGVEPFERERAHDLAHPVGAEVDAEHAVPVPNPWGARDDPRLHELVGLARLVGLTYGAHRVGRGLADAVHHRVVGDPGPLPALVAVHRVVAAHDRGDHGPAPVLPEEVDELLHEGEGGLGRRVPAVEPGVDRHRQLVQVSEHHRRDEGVVESVRGAFAQRRCQVGVRPSSIAFPIWPGRKPQPSSTIRTTGVRGPCLFAILEGMQFSHALRALPVVCSLAPALPAPSPDTTGQAAARYRVATDGEWFYQEVTGKRLARLARGAVVTGGDTKGEWIGVTLDGWIFGTSVGVTPRAGFDLAVTRAPEENLRAAPGGTIVAKLAEGFLLTK